MLMTAALSGKADAVRLLLTRGATVDDEGAVSRARRR